MKDKTQILKAIEEMRKERNWHYDKAYAESKPLSTLHFNEVSKLDAKISVLEWVIS